MIKKLAGTFVAAGALLVFAAPAAVAAPPEPFTIIESIDADAEEFRFTATGGLCLSGTFADDVHAVGAGNASIPKVNLLIRTVFTCDDGSGTFFAQKHVFRAFNEDGSFTNTGPVTLRGGTGAFTELSGHGADNGSTNEFGIGEGEILGVLQLG